MGSRFLFVIVSSRLMVAAILEIISRSEIFPVIILKLLTLIGQKMALTTFILDFVIDMI